MNEEIRPLAWFRKIAGTRHGKLVAIHPCGRSNDNHILWMCKCDCGNTAVVQSNSFTRKNGSRSCGCLRRDSRQWRKPWNTGKTYSTMVPIGSERVYKQRHGWSKAVRRVKGNRCEKCGWGEAQCDVDHITPKSRGGINIISNGMVLCPNHHRIKTSLGWIRK